MAIVIDQHAIIEDRWIVYDGQKIVSRVGWIIGNLAYLLDNWKQLDTADCSLGVELVVTDRVEDIEVCLPRLVPVQEPRRSGFRSSLSAPLPWQPPQLGRRAARLRNPESDYY